MFTQKPVHKCRALFVPEMARGPSMGEWLNYDTYIPESSTY